MTRKKGLEAVRASLDSIFSPEGLKNIQLLREGTLTTLPEDSFAESSVEEPLSPVEADPATQPAEATRHFDMPNRHDDTPVQPAAMTCCDNMPSKPAAPIRQDGSPSQHVMSTCRDNRPLQAADTAAPEGLPIKLHPQSGIRTKAQAKVLAYLERTGSHITNYQLLRQETGVPVRTIRDIFAKFAALGWMEKTPWAQGAARGIRIIFHGVCRDTSPIRSADTIRQYDPPIKCAMANCHDDTPRQPAFSSVEEEREAYRAFSQEDCRLHWPRLFRCGFGPDQIARIMASLSRLGKPSDRVIQGLTHIEFELAHGQMVDKEGQPVADPCSWAFRALAQNGYYRRPKGYVSPEEQALLDQEEEARAVFAAKKKAEQAQFEIWQAGLSPREMEEFLRECPGGPKDAWLKHVWKEKVGL